MARSACASIEREEIAVTSWEGANGLISKRLFGTPGDGHSYPESPVM